MDGVELIKLPKIEDPRGNLTFFQNHDHIPFEIARITWIYDVPSGEKRRGFANYSQEVIIALSGSFDVVIKIEDKMKRFTLNRSYHGLYLPALSWRFVENFSTNSQGLLISSKVFTGDDYIWNFSEQKNMNANEQKVFGI